MQIFEYNGAAVVAMAGKNCVAIGSDLRLGVQFQTLACDYKKVYPIHEHLYLGLAGLGTDSQTLCVLVLLLPVSLTAGYDPHGTLFRNTFHAAHECQGFHACSICVCSFCFTGCFPMSYDC